MYNHLITNNILQMTSLVSVKVDALQLLVTMNDWLGCLDKKAPVDAAYLAFKRVFDSVPHKRHLTQLKS